MQAVNGIIVIAIKITQYRRELYRYKKIPTNLLLTNKIRVIEVLPYISRVVEG
jgi:hypothetical protein